MVLSTIMTSLKDTGETDPGNPTTTEAFGESKNPKEFTKAAEEAAAGIATEFSDTGSLELNQAQGDTKEEGEPVSTTTCYTRTNGRFFGYVSLPMIFFTACIFTAHLVVFLHGYGWDRNPAKLALELREPIEETPQEKKTMNSHAILGLVVAATASFQVVSAVRFSWSAVSAQPQKHRGLRKAHGWIGRFTFVAWTVVAVSGAIVSVCSKRKGTEWGTSKIYLVYLFLTAGVATVGNMTIGIWAVLKPDRDMFLHKAGMYFSLSWILSSALAEVLITIVQLLHPDCPVEFVGGTLIVLASELTQWAGFILAAWWFDPAIFRSKLVRFNLLIRLGWIVTFAVSVPLVLGGLHNPDECFAPDNGARAEFLPPP